eukprot:3103810-Pyramimonas_sp.AAC.1
MCGSALIRSALTSHPEHVRYLHRLQVAAERWAPFRVLTDLRNLMSPHFWDQPAYVEHLASASHRTASSGAAAARALLTYFPEARHAVQRAAYVALLQDLMRPFLTIKYNTDSPLVVTIAKRWSKWFPSLVD